MQNAHDLHASEVRVALRRGTSTELLMWHDGDRVTLPNVLAMTFAFLSTKREDPRTKGRFGVGLKTLNQLGDELLVHSPPYHFKVERGTLRAIESATPLKGLYSARAGETLFRLRLRRGFDKSAFAAWFAELGASTLLFLDAVRSLSLKSLRSERPLVSHRITEHGSAAVELEMHTGSQTAVRAELQEPGTSRRWTRYTVEYPVPKHLRRAHKATGETTPLAVAIPHGEGECSPTVAAGLPLPVASSLPFSVNAQFDPDTARAGIRQVQWNEWLFDRSAMLLPLWRSTDSGSSLRSDGSPSLCRARPLERPPGG